MIRHVSLCLVFAAAVAAGPAAYAQGHRPAGAGGPASAGGPTSAAGQSFGHAPTFGGSLDSQRLHSDAGQATADANRAAAEAKRQAGRSHNKSEEKRAAHPPNEHAADEAFLAEQNAGNKDLRDQRKDLKGKNRGDHGKK